MYGAIGPPTTLPITIPAIPLGNTCPAAPGPTNIPIEIAGTRLRDHHPVIGLLQQRYGRHIGFRERRFGRDLGLGHCWESRQPDSLTRATDIGNLSWQHSLRPQHQHAGPSDIGSIRRVCVTPTANSPASCATPQVEVIQLRLNDGTLNLGNANLRRLQRG